MPLFYTANSVHSRGNNWQIYSNRMQFRTNSNKTVNYSTDLYRLEMWQYIDISPYHDTLRQWYSIDTNSSHIHTSNIVIYQHIGTNTYIYTAYIYTACIYTVFIGWINYCTLQLSALQLNNFREQKKVMSICQNLLIYTVLYHAIYRCIMILWRQCIGMCKLCIIPSLVLTS